MLNHLISRFSGTGLIVLSLTALLTVLIGLAMALRGYGQPQADEGALAHIFQLSVAASLPTALIAAATTDWQDPLRSARPLVFAAGALLLAFVLLYYGEHCL